MKNFKTFNLAVNFYRQTQCQKLPAVLKYQLEKASSSIALNLAEGRGREKTADQKRFFTIAMGSVRECQAILNLANLTNSQAWQTLDILAAHLFNLIKYAK